MSGPPVAPPPPGTHTSLVTTKWRDRPHWTYPSIYLGADGYGDWFGHPVGTRYVRPGVEIIGRNAMVSLVPATTSPVFGTLGRSWLASFHALPSELEVYVDVTTEPSWVDTDPPTVQCVDLDLDVIRGRAGRVWIDDEDEFAAHRIEWSYPADVVASAGATADALVVAIRARTAPFDGATDARWHAALADLT
ncbi:MAG: DUF402 domain-containing protein [Nocardioides sp.]